MYETIEIIISKKMPMQWCQCNAYIHILKQVKASSDIFGDPCEGVLKYFEVEYQCQGIWIMKIIIQINCRFKYPRLYLTVLLNDTFNCYHMKLFVLCSIRLVIDFSKVTEIKIIDNKS